MLLYHILNLVLWGLGFGVIIWKAGWLAAAGLFLVLWANNMQQNATMKEAELKEKQEQERIAKETAHIRSDPERFGDDPTRTRYM